MNKQEIYPILILPVKTVELLQQHAKSTIH